MFGQGYDTDQQQICLSDLDILTLNRIFPPSPNI